VRRNYRLLFGPLAEAILAFGIAGLELMIPDYSHVHQTVGEIGAWKCLSVPETSPFSTKNQSVWMRSRDSFTLASQAAWLPQQVSQSAGRLVAGPKSASVSIGHS